MADHHSAHIDIIHLPGIEHHPDCDTHYAHSPVERAVCNVSESHNFMPDVRECLQHLQDHGVGVVDRHVDCFADHFGLTDAHALH